MHKPVASPNAPKRLRAHHVCRSLTGVLDYAVPCADVVEGKIAERTDNLVSQSRGHSKRSAVNNRPGSGGRELAGVTNVASCCIKKGVAAQYSRRDRPASGSSCRRH